MSRILAVNSNIDRGPVPEEAQWWRHVLQPNEDRIVYTMQLGVFDQGVEDIWAWDVEYYDGRDDWSFPYVYKIWQGTPRGFHRWYIPNRLYVLDVLDFLPPGVQPWSDLVLPNWQWEGLTDWGDHEHPGTMSLPSRYDWQ